MHGIRQSTHPALWTNPNLLPVLTCRYYAGLTAFSYAHFFAVKVKSFELQSTMTLRLVRAESADIDQLDDIYFKTFKRPVRVALLPDVPAVREWHKKVLTGDMEKSYYHFYKIVDAGSGSAQGADKIIAWAKWESPHTASSDDKPPEWPSAGDPVRFQEVVRNAKEMKKKILGDKESWCKLSTPS